MSCMCLYLHYSRDWMCPCGVNSHFVSSQKQKQELSYRQQIARQLRTQYAEGIYRLKYYTVTLKSRLKVTQGH